MNQRILPLLAAAATVFLMAGCGGSGELVLETGPGEEEGLLLAQAPASAELRYGQSVYLKSANWQTYLSVGTASASAQMTTADPQRAETWVLVDPACNKKQWTTQPVHKPLVTDDCANGKPLRFRDRVLLRSSRTGDFLAPSTDRDLTDLQLRETTMGSDPFELIDPAQPQSTGQVPLNGRAMIWSASTGRYLSARSPGGRDAVLMTAGGSDMEQWYLAAVGSTRNSGWMAEMEADLRKVRLTKAVLPGSHDAGTYSIADDAAFSPDLPLEGLSDLKERLMATPRLVPRVNYFMSRFARAQGRTIGEQLNAGIRYFDLRPGASDNGAGSDLLVVHSLYGGDILGMIDQVAAFLALYPKEVVILDFSHHTAMGPDHHAKLISHITGTFGAKLVPRPANATQEDPKADGYTFGDLWDQGWQVVALYQSDYAGDETKLWRYGTPSPNDTRWWPNKPTPEQVKTHLDNLLATERPQLKDGALFVLQTVLTGDPPLYAKAILRLDGAAKLGATLDFLREVVAALQGKVEEFGGGIYDANKNIETLNAAIGGKQHDIDTNQSWIDGHPYFWDAFGRALREGWIADLKADILRLQGEIFLAEQARTSFQSAYDAATSGLDAARAQIAQAQQQLDALEASSRDAPTSLAELADAGNPTMMGWLEGWRDKGLNIIIRDLADTAFVDQIRLLNRKQ